jgi:hypothetical protein
MLGMLRNARNIVDKHRGCPCICLNVIALLAFGNKRLQTDSMSTESTSAPLFEGEWEQWYRMTPQQRWRESRKLWEFFLAIGGSLDPEPDSQSPFDPDYEPRQIPLDGRTGVRIVRRSRV